MPSSLQQEQQKPDMHHLKSILDDNSLTFAEKAISIKNVEINKGNQEIYGRRYGMGIRSVMVTGTGNHND